MSIKPQLRSKDTRITSEVYINRQVVKTANEATIFAICFTKDLSWIHLTEHVIKKALLHAWRSASWCIIDKQQ